jgi:hypothetical protein
VGRRNVGVKPRARRGHSVRSHGVFQIAFHTYTHRNLTVTLNTHAAAFACIHAGARK